MNSIILDHCWVCNAKFIGVGGATSKEEHHIVPQAYGGSEGPTVTLCDSHHTKIHKIAVALKNKKPYSQLLLQESEVKKLMWLANTIYKAELATRDDPNKATTVSLRLSNRHTQMVDHLQRVTGKKSRGAVLLLALELLHSRHFK